MEKTTRDVWPGWCHFPDFTKPETRAWWAEQFKDYVALGVDGFWNDMNEIVPPGDIRYPKILSLILKAQKPQPEEEEICMAFRWHAVLTKAPKNY